MTATLPTTTTNLTLEIKTPLDISTPMKPYKETTPYSKLPLSPQKYSLKYFLDERYFEYQSLRCKYPDFIPVAFENYMASPKNKLTNEIINFRFYTAKDMKIGIS